MSIINCTDKSCKYQTDGKCEFNSVVSARISSDGRCAYYAAVDNENGTVPRQRGKLR